jgi:hypothetical protein
VVSIGIIVFIGVVYTGVKVRADRTGPRT